MARKTAAEKLIEVIGIVWENKAVGGFFDRKNSFEKHTFSFLDVLPHGVKVGGEVNAGGENSLTFLSLAFAKKLLPPLGKVVKPWGEVNQNFHLLALLVKGIAGCSIYACGVLVKSYR